MSEDDNEIQLNIYRQMTPEQKLKVAQRLFDSAQALKAAALRAQHPDWTEEMIWSAVRKIFLNAQT